MAFNLDMIIFLRVSWFYNIFSENSQVIEILDVNRIMLFKQIGIFAFFFLAFDE